MPFNLSIQWTCTGVFVLYQVCGAKQWPNIEYNALYVS